MSKSETGSPPASPTAPMGIEDLMGHTEAGEAAAKDAAAFPPIVSDLLKLGDLEVPAEKLTAPSSVEKMHAAAMAHLSPPTGASVKPVMGIPVPADAETVSLKSTPLRMGELWDKRGA